MSIKLNLILILLVFVSEIFNFIKIRLYPEKSKNDRSFIFTSFVVNKVETMYIVFKLYKPIFKTLNKMILYFYNTALKK